MRSRSANHGASGYILLALPHRSEEMVGISRQPWEAGLPKFNGAPVATVTRVGVIEIAGLIRRQAVHQPTKGEN